VSKTLLVSSAPPSWKPLTDVTWAVQKKYADAMRYDFHTDVSDIRTRATSAYEGWPQMPDVPLMGFIKLDLMLHFLDPDSCKREYEWVWWMDADCLPTTFEEPLPVGKEDELILPFDANGINFTVVGARNTNLVRDLLWAADNAGKTMFARHSWREMEAVRYFLQTPPYQDIASWYSVHDLCAMPNDVFAQHIPDITRKQYEWTPESLAVHFSAMRLEDRVRMAKEWVERLGLLP
jgi:hypothetical protein